MGVLQADASTVIGVSGGLADANTQATSFENAFSIGGQFNTVAKAWIDSFPSEYPGDRRRYDAGKSTYAVNNITHTTNNWSQFGYSSSTQSTGSSGWIFWSTGSSETDTTTRNVVNIDEASFGTGIEVSAWGIATFPIQYGQWCSYCLSHPYSDSWHLDQIKETHCGLTQSWSIRPHKASLMMWSSKSLQWSWDMVSKSPSPFSTVLINHSLEPLPKLSLRGAMSPFSVASMAAVVSC